MTRVIHLVGKWSTGIVCLRGFLNELVACPPTLSLRGPRAVIRHDRRGRQGMRSHCTLGLRLTSYSVHGALCLRDLPPLPPFQAGQRSNPPTLLYLALSHLFCFSFFCGWCR